MAATLLTPSSGFAPPFHRLAERDDALANHGYALLNGPDVLTWLGASQTDLTRLHEAWPRLPPDPHLLDGGRYRRRRHACYVVDQLAVERQPRRPHWQPLVYNALHGGIERWFDPVEETTDALPIWQRLLQQLAETASRLHGRQRWFIEAHPFRIDTADGIGRPTPEGAHRDGVELVAVMLLERHNIKGGESRIFSADGPDGKRFTLEQPGALMLLDDHRIIHETTPIQPLNRDQLGWRDTLVVTCRAGAFQGPDSP
ncbi:MAG: 2OG-Fe dioxygenase family protein [Wenzhouxiangella sp.]